MPDKQLTDLEHLESQLLEVEERLKEAVGLLDSLRTVQQKFKELTAFTHQLHAQAGEAQERLEAAGVQFGSLIEETKKTLSESKQSIGDLMSQNEVQWAAFRSTLVKAQEDLHSAQRNLRSELSLQVNDLRGEVERRLEQFSLRQQSLLSEVGQKYQEVVDKVDQEHQELEKQQKKVRDFSAALAAVETRLKQANGLAIGAMVVAVVVSILGFMLGR